MLTTMKTVFSFIFSTLLLIHTSCSKDYALPVMGDYSVIEVEIDELSGLCFNKDHSALLACGDKGVVKSITFEGETAEIWKNSSDMEGITIDPSNGDIYLAIEGKQEVHILSAPDYDEQKNVFVVQEAIDGYYSNSGLEAVEFYKNKTLFVGSQKCANIWRIKTNGKVISKISISDFAFEVAGLCYEPETDWLWVSDSKNCQIYICKVDGTLLATYDIPFIDNAESICVDREAGCVWVGSDEKETKLYKIDFEF